VSAQKISEVIGNTAIRLGTAAEMVEMPPETPFRLLVCGNLSGSRPNPVPFGKRKPILIDRDNFDEVLAKLAPSVTLPDHANQTALTISFADLDDFEPDRLFRRLPVFEELRSLLADIADPAKFSQGAMKIRAWAKLPEEAALAPPADPAAADVLQQLIEADRAASELDEWQQFLRKVAHPHLVATPDPRQADYTTVVEQSVSAQMRAILHHPAYQSLEAAWRSVFLLVRRLETDSALQVFVLDAKIDELRGDLAQTDPRESTLVREVIERGADAPWAAMVSLETFGKTSADLAVLASMTVLAGRARTPLLAAVAPTLVGCPSLSAAPEPVSWKPDSEIVAAWDAIRNIDEANHLGVVIPRFLLRRPYGKYSTETESFVFEEMPTREHKSYLWGSGAVLCGLWLAEVFAASGWPLNLEDSMEVTGLPVHVYHEDGEACMKPCAEVLLRETALVALMDRGLMVLTSVRDEGSVRLPRFQSVSCRNKQLSGRW
jgi:type VI secretion system protein ImpC